MSNSQLILLLIIIVVFYLFLKKADPYQDFKKWLDRHPNQKHKLGQELCDEIFIRPESQEAFAYCWEIAVNQTPIPDDLLSGNKILIPIIREYLREQKGVIVKK
jgi:hypothetical protein